jgi:pimeloyl-ACP methyl ester carboxylesterase
MRLLGRFAPADAAPLRQPRPAARRPARRAAAAPPRAAAAADAAEASTISLDAVLLAGPARLCAPLAAPAGGGPADAGRAARPLMLYLPGIDGTGLAAARQFPRLLSRFDLVTLVTPPDDRTDFAGLVAIVVAFLEAEVPLHAPTRPVYLLGESFGGVLALAAAAAAPGLVDRLVLVNPATSFGAGASLWPLLAPLLPGLPDAAYRALPLALAPALGNPFSLLAAALEGAPADATAGERAGLLAAGAAQLLRQLPLLADLLPPATLEWKLRLLAEGCAAVAPALGRVQQRALLLVGDADLLLPSAAEGRRLAAALPRARLRVLAGGSHAALQEGGVDLVAIMEEEGALVAARRLSAPAARRSRGAGFGTAAAIELPTPVELAAYSARATAFGRRLTSPVFFSTAADGAVVAGLGAVPLPAALGRRPVLFVGNHQTMALDLGVLCEQFVAERGALLRGLAHPSIFAASGASAAEGAGAAAAGAAGAAAAAAGGAAAGGAGGFSPFDLIPALGEMISSGAGPSLPNPFGGGGGAAAARAAPPADSRAAFSDFLLEFGAVPVSARNLLRLLAAGESVLLFPGGVREAYKRRGEAYSLHWPDRAEFVRAAAKHNALIVPFAAVGVDDGLEMILDSGELVNAPLGVGAALAARAGALPAARRGVAAGGGAEELFVAPLVAPRLPPRRLYFWFRRPIETSSEDLADRARCEEIYREARGSVEGGLAALLAAREEDPYRDFARRALYEAGGRAAPTFAPERLRALGGDT